MGSNKRKLDGRNKQTIRTVNNNVPNNNNNVCCSNHGRSKASQHSYERHREPQHTESKAWGDHIACITMEYSILATTFLAIVLYLNTLPAEFAYDDSRAILKNPDLLPTTPIGNLFLDDFWGTPLTHSGSHKSYRPLCVLTFRINYYLGGLNPWGYHLGNVLLHALVTALFTYTAQQLLRKPVVSLVAGAMFASHPIHTEAVAGIVGRADILSCMFFLLAFLSYMKYCKFRDKDKGDQNENGVSKTNGHSPGGASMQRFLWLLCVAMCTLAAMLSKELGITVLAVCGVYDVFLVCKVKVKDLWRIIQHQYRHLLEGLLCLAVIGSSLIVFRILFMGSKPPEFAPADNPASDSDSLLTRILTYNYLPFVNLWLLLYPKVLSFDWSMGAVPLVESLADPRNLCTLTLYGSLGCTVLYLIGRLNYEDVERTSHDGKSHNGNGYAHHMSNNHHHSNNGHVHPVTHNGKSSTVRKRIHNRRGSGSSTDSSSDDLPATVSLNHKHHQHTLHILILSLAFIIFPFIPATNLFFYIGFVIAERVLYIPSIGFCLLVTQTLADVYRTYCVQSVRHRRVLTCAVLLMIVTYSVRTVIRNEDWGSEEKLYRAGIPVNPAKAWGNLANILNNQGRHQEAEEAYRTALQYRANMADVHYNLGILLQEQKRYPEAIESYHLAIQCRPRLTMAHLNLGIVYANLGHSKEAEEMYRKCAEIDISGLKDPRLHEQTKISALYNLGRLLADQDRFREAIDVYEEAIRRRPGHYAPQSLYNMLGEAYSKLDNLMEAEHWYKEALKAKPEHVPAHLTMAKLLFRKGKVEEAESWFFKAQSLDPKDSSVYQHYGQFLNDVGRHEEAAESYLKAAHYSPDDFELIFNTANALRQAQRDPDAEEYYRKAVKLRPKEATAYMNLGAMLHFNGKLHDAEKSYLAALQLKPEDSITRSNLQKVRNLISKAKTTNGKR